MGAVTQAVLAYGGASGLDPYFSNVVLLAHFDGANGATSTVDSSSSAHTMTMNGNTKLDSAQAKFGGTSLNMKDATGVGTVLAADSADWDFGSGQFSGECWVYFTAAPANTRTIVHQRGSSGNRAWHLGFFSGTSFGFRYTTGGTTEIAVEASWSPTLNTWYHLAFDRDASDVLRVYIDGAVHASAAAAATIFNSTNTLGIGNSLSAFGPLLAYIDELRITKGVARYAGAFTPPTAAFPNS